MNNLKFPLVNPKLLPYYFPFYLYSPAFFINFASTKINDMAKKKDNTTSIGFEETIWRATDKLRGNLNAAEYEGVVLGLIFL